MSTRTIAGRMQAFPTTQILSTRWFSHLSQFDILPHDAIHHSSVWPIKHVFMPLFRNCILGSSMSSELTLKPFPALLERRSSSSRWSKNEDNHIITTHLLYEAMYGSTGDVTPWHGYPICPDSLPDCYLDGNSEEVKIPFWANQYNFASQFLEYVRFTNLVFYTEYQPTQPRIHLVLNGGGILDH